MRRKQRIAILAGSLAVAALLAVVVLRQYERHHTTDDAYVNADVVGIVAQVAGPIVNLAVEDN